MESFFAIGRVRSSDRQRETERQKVRNRPLGGMVTPQSLLLHSPLGILGTHAHAPGVSFKPPGLGREPRLTTWESSVIAITLTAGLPKVPTFFLSFFFFFWRGFCYRARALARKTERQRQKVRNHPPEEWPRRNPFSSFLLSGSWARTHTRLV